MGKENGYIKVWRKLRENPIYKNSKAVHVWLECLMRATYQEREVYNGRDKLELEPGQFVMGRQEFGDVIGMSGSTAWYWIQEFEADNMINIKSTAKGTTVTIENWDDYQKDDNTPNNKKTAKKQQKNTNNKGKNVKKVKKVLKTYKKKSSESSALTNHSDKIFKRDKKYISSRLDDGFTVEECIDAIKGVDEAYNSDNSWWSRQRDLESLFKRKKGKFVEQFSKWHNGKYEDSGLANNNNSSENNGSDRSHSSVTEADREAWGE